MNVRSESEGYRPARYYYRMLIELHEEPPAPSWPEGIGAVFYEKELAGAV